MLRRIELAAGGAAIISLIGVTMYQLRLLAEQRDPSPSRGGRHGPQCAGERVARYRASIAGGIDEAIDSYTAALAIDPDYPAANNNLGYLLAARGEKDQAIGLLQRAVELKPDYAEAHNNLANLLAERGERAGGHSHHQRAIALDPSVSEFYHNFAMTLLDIGQQSRAAAMFEQALRLRPNYAAARLEFGLLLSQRGDPPPRAAAPRRVATSPGVAAGAACPRMAHGDDTRRDRSQSRSGGGAGRAGVFVDELPTAATTRRARRRARGGGAVRAGDRIRASALAISRSSIISRTWPISSSSAWRSIEPANRSSRTSHP